MSGINMRQARTHLSRLVQAGLIPSIERGEEREIVIARNGRPVAKRVPVGTVPAERRIGVAKGLFDVPADIEASNPDVARLFLGDADG